MATAGDRGSDHLDEYRAKRNFGHTPEPSESSERGEQRRFVVQEHHARRLHWDLRLEHGGVLLSWAIPNGIPHDPKRNRKAIHVEDHPLSYLTFQGTIPQGNYGAGTVEIWDSGTYELEKFLDREIIFTLHGRRLSGRYALFRAGEEHDWMIHRMDPPARERQELPAALSPMLASAGEMPTDESGWAYEIKWDGLRALFFWEPGRMRILSRNGNDLTARYPELRGLGEQLGSREVVLDGEIVAFDGHGRPSFELLQSRMNLTSQAAIRRLSATVPVSYMIFDLLFQDGEPLYEVDYLRRRELLEDLSLAGPNWLTPEHHRGQGRALLELIAQQGLEGLIAKRLDSVYRPGERSRNWLKIKNSLRQEFVIGGWLENRSQRGRVGALLLGYHDTADTGALRYVGRAGSGLSERALTDLEPRLVSLQSSQSPFDDHPRLPGAHWVKPELVCEVQFTGFTESGVLRHPRFKGMRADKSARQVVLERPMAASAGQPSPPTSGRPSRRVRVEIQRRRLTLTNTGKVLYPESGFTKGDLIDYYTAVAPVLIGHLAGHPLTLKRYPNGVREKYFFQKNCPAHRPGWVRTVAVPSERRTATIDYCLADDLPTLVWLANLAAIELHSSLALASDLTQPRSVVFDLDPGAPAGQRECAQVALMIRRLLAGLGLRCVVKSSGSKGLQVYLPLNSGVVYDQTKAFAHTVARALESTHPTLVVSSMAKRLRRGKVLIDWSQNDPHKTTVCVYSARATERPFVSTPLRWDEVQRAAEPGEHRALSADPAELLARVELHGDLFSATRECTQKLPALTDAQARMLARPVNQLGRGELQEIARVFGLVGRSRMTVQKLRDAITTATDG